jgi:DNA-binding transcriptional regulator LsrR (DeoR family)
MSEPIRNIIEWQSKNPDAENGVAEIVLRLYPTATSRFPAEFLDAIRETNSHVIAVDPERIRGAGEVILIAGGAQKIDALYAVLMDGCPDAPIDKRNLTLVTDSWTAETLLARVKKKA